MKHTKKLLPLLVLPVLALGGIAMWRPRAEASSRYRTGTVQRLDLVDTIRATGTVVPEDVVDVGAQINGQIASFGTDAEGHPIDFRSTVTQGMVLAHIDDALFQADLATAEAQLAQANAEVKRSEADLVAARAKADQAQRDWDRVQGLEESPALSREDFDAARSTHDQTQAAVAVAEAEIVQAHASVAAAEATVTRARRNLAYCTIASPVDGVILDRRVEIGQTVVASLNAPSLFLIARDLRRMRVLVQVNEADIGHVVVDQEVAFTVDALPERSFRGSVRKVRLNASLTQNVVTYTVEISADNSDLALLPYLTASVVFEVARRENALAVPNAALRWSPRERAAEAPPGGGSNAARNTRATPTVWLLEGDELHPVEVKTGLSDGTFTEIMGTEVVAPENAASESVAALNEGALVVIGDSAAAAGPAREGASPFTPQMTRGRGGR